MTYTLLPAVTEPQFIGVSMRQRFLLLMAGIVLLGGCVGCIFPRGEYGELRGYEHERGSERGSEHMHEHEH